MTKLEPTSARDPEPAEKLDMRWGSGASALDRLLADSSSFGFYQAVKILSLLYAGGSGLSLNGAVPVRFRSQMAMDFPGSDIESFLPHEKKEPLPRLLINFLGLAGANGPLPAVYTGALLRPRPGALRDFLDIFNHRLILLLYRVHEMHHPELAVSSPSHGLAADHLYTSFGLGRDSDAASRNRMTVPDGALLYYSGILAHRPHSASGLRLLLSDYFEADVAIEEFVGSWLNLASDQWTRIGTRSGSNQTIGDGAILGKRVWDQHARILIRIGPLTLKAFESFLPNGDAYHQLRDLTRFYLGDEIDFDVTLELRVEEIPWARGSFTPSGSEVRQASLGRLAWLKSAKNGHTNGSRVKRSGEADLRGGVAVDDGEI